jgi:hypothetical protein
MRLVWERFSFLVMIDMGSIYSKIQIYYPYPQRVKCKDITYKNYFLYLRKVSF